MASIIGSIIAAIFGRFLEFMKQRQLERAAALADELKQYAESIKKAEVVENTVYEAVVAHEAAAAHVDDLEAQLEAIRKWNKDHVRSKVVGDNVAKGKKEDTI